MFRVGTKRDVNQLAKRMVNAEKRKHEWPLTFGTQPSLSSSTRGGGTCFQNSMKGIGRETRRELRFARKIYELPCGNGMKLSQDLWICATSIFCYFISLFLIYLFFKSRRSCFFFFLRTYTFSLGNVGSQRLKSGQISNDSVRLRVYFNQCEIL